MKYIKINVNVTSPTTPLIAAIQFGDLEFVKFLVSSGADVNLLDAKGNVLKRWEGFPKEGLDQFIDELKHSAQP